MKSFIRHPVTAASFVAAAGLIFVACSESPTAPASGARPAGGAELALVPVPGGSTTIAINSNGSTQYCGIAASNVNPAAPPGTTFVGSCGVSNDISTAANGLGAYNPGWDHPFTGSDWIGPTGADAPSNQYFARPGTYDFKTTFTLPAGATGVGLNLSAMGDNVVQVFLNGHPIGANTPIQDCPPSFACNWLQPNALQLSDVTPGDFNIPGTNTIEIFLIDTFIGVGGGLTPPAFNGNSCHKGPQDHGFVGFTSTPVTTNPDFQAGGAGWSETTCLNPAGLDFSGVAFYTPAATGTTWCSPGFWKNHGFDLWTKYHNNLYSSLGAGAAPLSKKAPAGDPTLATVIANPNIYGGPATNSVADFLSNKAFGTPIGSGVEDDKACDAFAKGPGL